jgi:hypothetical protein
MQHQKMLPNILHGCHFNTTSSFSIKNYPELSPHTIISAELTVFQKGMFLKTKKWKSLQLVIKLKQDVASLYLNLL